MLYFKHSRLSLYYFLNKNNILFLCLCLPIVFVFIKFGTFYGFAFCGILLLSILCFLVPNWVMYLWILLSFIGAGFEIDLPGFPPLHIVEILLIPIFSLWFLNTLIKKQPIRPTPLDKPFGAFLLWAGVTVMVVNLKGTTTEPLIWQINAYLLMVFTFLSFWFVYHKLDYMKFNEILFPLVLSCIPVMVYQFYLFFTSGELKIGYSSRVFSSMGGNMLGAYYNAIILLLLGFLSYPVKKGFFKSFLCVTLLTFLVGCQLITFSRASLLAGALSIIFLFILLKKKSIFIFLFLLLTTLFINKEFLFTFLDSFNREGSPSYHSVLIRQDIVIDNLRIIRENPFWGIGLDWYRDYSNIFSYNEEMGVIPMSSAHNDFLQVAVNVGIPGLILYLWTLAIIGKRALRLWRSKDNSKSIIGSVYLSIYFQYIFQAFFSESIMGAFSNGMYEVLSYTICFWIITALMLKVEERSTNWQPIFIPVMR